MVSPISPRAVAYIRDRATAVMTYTVRVERVTGPSYDEDTLIATPGGRSTIYEGPCRIWEVSGPGMVLIGEDEYSTQTTNMSIPWDTTPIPKRHDQGVVIDCDTDPNMVGRRFKINDVVKSGQMRATRRFSISFNQEG